jgi:triacylglycerol lipase
VDLLLKAPDGLVRFVGFCTDCWFRLLGDKNPHSYSAFHAFRTESAEAFNLQNPDDPRVYYQSYSFVMKHPFSDIFMWLPALAVWMVEGENDGLLPPSATRWGDYKGICRGVTGRGISHCDEVDMRRYRLTNRKGDGISDIVDVYTDALQALIEQGL